MKMKYSLLIIFPSVILVFSSCMLNREAEFARRKYFNFPLSENKLENKTTGLIQTSVSEKSQDNKVTERKPEEDDELSASVTKDFINENSASDAVPASFQKKIKKAALIIPNESRQSEFLGKPKQQIQKKTVEAPPPSDRLLLEVIVSIFIPPLAVFLHQGDITDYFWIDLILTLLFWFPGIIFALLVVLDFFG